MTGKHPSSPRIQSLKPLYNARQIQEITAQLYERNVELSTRNRTLTTLHHLYDIINSSIDVEKTAQLLIEKIIQELQFEIGAIALVNAHASKITVVAEASTKFVYHSIQNPLTDLSISLHKNDNAFTKAVKHEHRVVTTRLTNVIPSHTVDPEIVRQYQEKHKVRTCMLFPLSIGDRVLGVLLLGMNKEMRTLSRGERETLREIIDVISLGIERTEIYANLQHANQQLRELDHRKDEFVYIASHELRTPMTAIKNYLWLVINKESSSLSQRVKLHIMRAYVSTERLIKLVQDLLTVSRIEGKRLVLNIESINYVDLCRDVIETLSITAAKKNINLKLEEEEGVYKLKGDKTRASEVIQNLVGNAMKFSPERSVISIKISKNGHMIETRVIDTGEGIAKADMPRLFQKFGRLAHSYKKVAEAGGTGLGLYISKQIVEAHGGRVWAESVEGKGSTFIYFLPFEGTPEERAATKRAKETAKRVEMRKEK